MTINHISFDSKNSVSNLCLFGIEHPTDKCPNNNDNGLHKHGYTPFYDMLFSSMRYNNILLAEIGIYHNMSMKCWRKYFPNATLYGLEWNNDFIQKALSDNLYSTKYLCINVKDENSIKQIFQSINRKFDVIIEDSTHVFEDQIRVINNVHQYINPGGVLIIEDLFISEDEQRYIDELKGVEKYFSSATFVNTHHQYQQSSGWNNDKLLVLFRNDV